MPRIVEPPRHWQDWASWVLGIWLILSPWILMFSLESVPTRVAVITGILLLVAEAVTLSAFRPWEEWANVVLGIWLLVSTLVFGIRNVAVVTDFVIVGVLVLILAFNEMRETRADPSPGA